MPVVPLATCQSSRRAQACQSICAVVAERRDDGNLRSGKSWRGHAGEGSWRAIPVGRNGEFGRAMLRAGARSQASIAALATVRRLPRLGPDRGNSWQHEAVPGHFGHRQGPSRSRPRSGPHHRRLRRQHQRKPHAAPGRRIRPCSILVTGNWHCVARLESELARLAESGGLALQLRRTEPRALREDHIPYSIDVIGPDHAGIVAGLAGFFTGPQHRDRRNRLAQLCRLPDRRGHVRGADDDQRACARCRSRSCARTSWSTATRRTSTRFSNR